MLKITGKQCKAARALLKWNVHDLANELNRIKPSRIEHFERGILQLLQWENEEMVKAFKKAGILFKGDLEVTLPGAGKNHAAQKIAVQGDGARIVLDSEQKVISDSSAAPITVQSLFREDIEEEQKEAKE